MIYEYFFMYYSVTSWTCPLIITDESDLCFFGVHFFFSLQHDAACRVISRLKKGRDEARQLLSEAERQLPAAPEVAPANATLSNGKRGMHVHSLIRIS